MKMAEDVKSDKDEEQSNNQDHNGLLLPDSIENYGTEFTSLSDTLAEVDAALQALESQSDALYDEAKTMLDEVKQDKAGVSASEKGEDKAVE
ncbi:uncharacterized protein [Watersipora subatra]|uniref:uncharacterized protein n=1 Tax=Watersipora subatra TaxID=2589382 RepID=UPI00355C9D78